MRPQYLLMLRCTQYFVCRPFQSTKVFHDEFTYCWFSRVILVSYDWDIRLVLYEWFRPTKYSGDPHNSLEANRRKLSHTDLWRHRRQSQRQHQTNDLEERRHDAPYFHSLHTQWQGQILENKYTLPHLRRWPLLLCCTEWCWDGRFQCKLSSLGEL